MSTVSNAICDSMLFLLSSGADLNNVQGAMQKIDTFFFEKSRFVRLRICFVIIDLLPNNDGFGETSQHVGVVSF